jgi:amidohydrolase
MESYVVKARRTLHEYPEIGFDLDRTLAFIRGDLDKMGIEYTEKFGRSSLVATINPEKSQFTIGIRADMDALPIIEKNDIPYKSKIDGQMHACGHDAHTAILLDTCRRLAEMRDSINCRVKFIFQAAEEFPPSGAMLMVNDGLMKDIDVVVALHVTPSRPVGKVVLFSGPRNATSDGFHLEFYGKAAHAANQHTGVDAIMMAVKAYTEIEFMVAKEVKATNAVLFNVGAFNGGTANNVVCDHCSMYCTLRTHEASDAELIIGKIKRVIQNIADVSGGRAEYVQDKHYPTVINDPHIAELMKKSAEKIIGEGNVITNAARGLGGEDFAYMLNEKPGCMFDLGVRNEELGYTAGLHKDNFMIDERALAIGSDIFVQFVLDNMNGI